MGFVKIKVVMELKFAFKIIFLANKTKYQTPFGGGCIGDSGRTNSSVFLFQNIWLIHIFVVTLHIILRELYIVTRI